MPLIKGQAQVEFVLSTNIEVIADNTDELVMVDSNDDLFRISKEDFLSGISNTSSFEIPTTVKTVAASGDYFIGIDSSGELYKISKANLLAGLSSGGDSTSNSSTFVNSGDTNGVFYYIGTTFGVNAWTNPSGNGVYVSASSIGAGNVDTLIDRTNSSFYTNSNPGSWVKFGLGSAKLKCNYYSIKSRADSADYYPRNWKLQGSNDDTTWADLDTQSNNSSLVSNSQWLSIPVTSDVAYSYFRILGTGLNSAGYDHLVLGEVELYGEYIPS
ncbi:discoidin domain-containing protein [Nostoc sp.]|uniref:discoidin domain-containing protein n=1 Tax=Nostoc sp. TaxID=1180 RepID=UPI002FFC1051